MANDNWSAMDVAATLLSRDVDRDRATSTPSGEMVVQPSPGFHPGEGRYVIDPDYMELLGLDDPEQLIKYHK